MASVTYGEYLNHGIATSHTVSTAVTENFWLFSTADQLSTFLTYATTHFSIESGKTRANYFITLTNSYNVPYRIYNGTIVWTLRSASSKTRLSGTGTFSEFHVTTTFSNGAVSSTAGSIPFINDRCCCLVSADLNLTEIRYGYHGAGWWQYLYKHTDHNIMSFTYVATLSYEIPTVLVHPSVRDILTILSIANGTFTYSASTGYITNSKANNTTYTLSNPLLYDILPDFLTYCGNKLFEKGYVSGVSTTDQLNPQSYISNNGRKVALDLRASNRLSGTTTASGSSGITGSMIYKTSESSVPCTYRINQWTSTGYEFYRDNAYTMDITDSTHDYDKFTYTSGSRLRIYPKIANETCYETIQLVLYDQDEGVIPWNRDDDLINKYYVPPTDVISYSDPYLYSVPQKTKGIYNFGPLSWDAFRVKYGSAWYEALHETYDQNYYVTPIGSLPGIATVKITTHGENFPSTPDSTWIAHSCENQVVTEDGIKHYCSVRYHMEGYGENSSFVHGGKRTVGLNTYRTSFYYVPVYKNTIEFIDRITDWNPYGESQWEDTIGGITYTKPIAYANKVSTTSDLVDKMTVLFARAIGYYHGDTDFGNARSDVRYFVWNECFASWFNVVDPFVKLKRTRSITINGTIYHEYNWPMRWMTYPEWTDPTAASFNYYSGLVVKKPNWPQYNAYDYDIVVFSDVIVPENKWVNAVTQTQSVGAGGWHLLKYNGYMVTGGGGYSPFNQIVSNENSSWNEDRLAIGDYSVVTSTNYYNLPDTLNGHIYNYYDLFGHNIKWEDLRYITNYYTSRTNNLMATNDILYTEPIE